MKSKATKIIFRLSFLPYILLFLYACYSAVAGFEFFGTSYGIDAFTAALFLGAIVLCIIPVIPICIIYDIIYLILRNRNSISKQTLKKMIIIFISILLLLGLLLLYSAYSYQISEYFQKRNAIKMIHQSEVQIPYCQNKQYVGGLLGIDGYTTNHILLDYDTYTIGFLVDCSFAEFHKYQLTKADDSATLKTRINKIYLSQAQIPLPDQKGTIYTYCNPTEYNSNITNALMLELTDGSCYYIEYLEQVNDPFSFFSELATSEYSTYVEPDSYH
ncbi:MAG: hypothetical protein Q4D51_10765 [Eubacteriales bacterium]|nr:hypothetical protein [Eubacteriales bacterium]